MTEEDDEERLLREVSLQNATSIFLARQRAEEELLRTKEALWQQSEWLRVTLASIGDAVVTTDTEGRVRSLNAVAERLTGWTQQEALARPLVEIFRIINQDTRHPVEDPAERALREGRIVGLAYHTILIARDGTETPIDDSAAPIRDEQGRIYGAVLIFRSIAERKQAEKARRQSQRELADFFENASVGLHWLGPDGTILRVNQAELNLLGYSREEYVGHHIAEFHADPDVLADFLRQLAAGEALRDYEARMRCKDGTIKHVLIDSSVRWEDSRFIHTRCFMRDITDRKRSEEAQARLAAIVESSQDAIISKTLEGRIVSWNAGAEQIFGYSAEEIIGRPISLLIPPERRDEEDMILEQLRHGERIEHFETVRVTKDGRRIEVSLTISPIRDSDGRIIGASKISRDITARKRAEQRLATQYGVVHILTESDSLEEAALKILETICEHLDWHVGALWCVDEHGTVLRCARVYHLPAVQIPRFEAVSRERIFERGIGLPGRVWASSKAAWIGDVAQDSNFPRADAAAAEGLHGAFGFPIMLNKEVLAVIELFSREIREPGPDLLAMMTAVGSQIGQFIEHKRAEYARRESEARKTAILDTALDSIISCDSTGAVQEFNPAAEQTFGFRRADVLGRDLADLIIPPRLRDKHRRGLAHYLATGEGPILNRRMEMTAVRADGSEFPVELAITRIPGEDPPLFTAYVRDITGRKLADDALRESESRFRQLADAMPQIVWAARSDGIVDYYNERWYEYTGFPRGDYGDQSWKPILHPDDVQRCVDTYYGCIRTGSPYEIEYRFKDRQTGGHRWFLGRAYPVRDSQGRIVRWFGTCTDIDDTKRTEESTRFLADASVVLAELTDQESALQKVAALAVPRFADWCGVDVREADGSVRRVALTHVDPAQVRLVRGLDSAFPSGAPETRGIKRVIRTGEAEWAASIPDEILGTLVQGEAHLHIIRELGLKSYISVPLKSRNKVVGALTFVTAESGRVYDADDVSAAKDLADRTVIAIENASLMAALKDSDQRKDEFLAILAHELRNPLAPVRNAVKVLHAKGQDVPEVEWARDVIDRQIDQMTRLVDDLLDVSRITRGKVELRRQRIELRPVVNDAVEACRPLIEKWGYMLSVEIPPEPIILEADPTRLAQVLLNLLNNAIKYTERGGRIWLTAELKVDQVVVSVKDTGVGIPRDMLPRIFDMFMQVDRSIERSQGGLGIGLTLVQRLVAMHGGEVEARSQGPGKGSEFIVRLPVAKDRDRGMRQDSAVDEPMRIAAKRRILVVDDYQDSADSLAMLLRIMGHEVRTARDGLAAVEEAETFQPGVVLLDIGLPKLNGYEVARRIRARRGGDVMLIAMTGWGQAEDRRRSKEAGFDHHLTKPVKLDELNKLLADINLHDP